MSWLALIGACTHPRPPEVAPPPPAPAEVVKSPVDGRTYRVVELPRGLTALVVSDPDTDVAAASLTVQVGHYADPPDRLGLAHFLEHMLFIGTDRYPEVDEYGKFVEDHGGSTNAGTSGEQTSFFFEVSHDALEPTLDRFSRFFVAPTLEAKWVDRERHAVDAEYSLKVKDGARRIRQVRKVTTNPAHPESKFSVGNLETLGDRDGDPVDARVREFWQREYRPDRMTLAVVGREPVEVLEQWVTTRFTEVPGAAGSPPAPRPPPFLPEQLGVRIDVVPLEDVRELELQFPLPAERPLWPFQPHQYVASLLAHQGDGAWYSALKATGWVADLSVGSMGDADDFDQFTVRLELTPAGGDHVDEIVASLFTALRKIREAGISADRYRELDVISDLEFRFSGETAPVELVRDASDALQRYPAEHALDYWAVPGTFADAEVVATLDLLTPANLRILYTAPGLPTDRTEPLYQVPYAIRALTDAEKATYAAGSSLTFGLPAPNPWLPADTALEPGDVGPAPVRLSADGARVEVWHHLDTSFRVPRDDERLEVFSPSAGRTPKDLVLGSLAERLLQDALEGRLYPVRVAGMDVTVDVQDRGLVIDATGFDDRKADLWRDTLAVVRGLRVEPARFEAERDELVRDWKNAALQRPIAVAQRATAVLLDHGRTEPALAAPIAEQVTAAELQAWLDALWTGASARLLVHGNRSAADAAALAASMEQALAFGGPAAPRPAVSVRRVPQRGTVVRELAVDHADSVFLLTLQGESTDPAAHARWMMLGQLIGPAFFSQLRTEQQLGYIVGTSYSSYDRVPGLQFAVQSSVLGPVGLQERVEAFERGQIEAIRAMDAAAFDTVRAGLLSTLRQADVELADRSARWAESLDLGVLTFDGREQVAREVEALDPAAMAAFAAQVLGPEQGRLIVRSFGHTAGAERPKGGCPDTACAAKKLAAPYSRDR